MPKHQKGHIERLPSGSLRVSVYASIDPITWRRVYSKSAVRDQAGIELGKLVQKSPTHAGRSLV